MSIFDGRVRSASERLGLEELRGHAFYPPEMDRVPGLYQTEETRCADKIVWLHYFCGGADWYIVEADLPWRHNPESDNTPFLAFGYVKGLSDYEEGEWGYIYLPDLEASVVGGHFRMDGFDIPTVPLLVERDLYWEPKPFREVI